MNPMNSLKIKKQDAILVLVDFQERLMPVMKAGEELEATVVKLVKGCKVLGVPILITEQYPKGLGRTVPAIREALGEDYGMVEKTSFSCMGEPFFVEALEQSGKNTVILAGIEAHVCEQQTVRDLLENGYRVFVVQDGISSRNNNDKKYAQRRMGDSGAIGTTMEAVLFELLEGARQPGFKEISAIVK